MSIFFDRFFMPAARIVAGDYWVYDRKRMEHIKPYEGRAWFKREFDAHILHPAIDELLDARGIRPAMWQQLLLEWPHRSVTDFNRVAYTRDERAGMADKQTITTLGKYLTRHFPDLPDHEIRDIVARHTATGEFVIKNDMDSIVRAATHGPRSCMSADLNIPCTDGHIRHPYEVYDPSLGWSVALRMVGDSIDGRALLWTDPETPDVRGFVRTYKRNDGGYSYADESLCAWLKANEYEHWSEWPDDTPMMYYEARNSFLAPYIDGGTQHVRISRGKLLISDSGEYDCSNTHGYGSEQGECCDCCGEYFDPDDMYWAGPHEDIHVCQGCIDHSYTYVYGRRGNQYYVDSDNAVYVHSQDDYFDQDYLSDNSIVCLENGEYEHMDNAVQLDNGEWYETDDSDICYDEYNDRHQLVRDCEDTEDMGMVHSDDVWQCAATGKYYTDNVERVEVNGETYHPDDAPETETNDE